MTATAPPEALAPATTPPRWRSGGADAGAEVLALAASCSLAALVLHHVAHSSLVGLFLYSADSLTLPLLHHAVAVHAPFRPVMSSQLLAFPEAPLYWLCAALTTSVRAALVLNALLNVALLHLLLRASAGAVAPGRPGRARVAAAAGVAVFATCCLLERGSGPGLDGTYLLTTYYYGVVVTALACTALSARQLRAEGRRARVALAVAAFAVATAAVASDPIFLLGGTAPLLVATAATAVARRLPAGTAALLAAPVVAGAVAGWELHGLAHRLLAASTGRYVDLGHAGAAVRSLLSSLGAYGDGVAADAELAVLAASVLGAAVVAGASLASRRRAAAPTVLVATMAAATPLATVAGVVVTGNSLLRYLLPATVVPLLALAAVAGWPAGTPGGSGAHRRPGPAHLRRRSPAPRAATRVALAAAAVAGCALFAAGGVAAAGVGPLLDPAGDTDVACMVAALGHRPAAGVGSYWAVRALEVYNGAGERPLQVDPSFSVYPWLVDLGEYEHQDLTFVIVDTVDYGPGFTITPAVASTLGHPSSTRTCAQFEVWAYPDGTPGHAVLNGRVGASLAAALRTYS